MRYVAGNGDDGWGGVVDVAGQRAGHLTSSVIVVVTEDIFHATESSGQGEQGHDDGKSEDLVENERFKLQDLCKTEQQKLTSLAILLKLGAMICGLLGIS